MVDSDGAAATSPEAEVVLASLGSYPEAEKAVDTLSDRGFPVDHVKIVARDVVVVEQVLGRFDYARAALYGASVGALLGLGLGLLFGLLNWIAPLTSGLIQGTWGLVLGALCGAILGVVGHSIHEGGHDFETVSKMEAGRWDVVTDAAHAEEGRRVLEPSTARPG